MKAQPWTTRGREVALVALALRRAESPERIDNGALPAGSPMHFYCVACGWLAEVKPEDFITPVRKLCGECQALKDCGWLE